MICALCKEREANKTNTHYLTDGIIRSCLNIDGSKDREKGLFFDLSSDNPFTEANFQRATPVDKLEKAFGREITDEEIEKAKKNPFSVDYVFCDNCENIFTKIENEFIKDLLPKFRNSNLSGISNLQFENAKLLRLFFYLQIWRTHVCDENFTLSSNVAEELRKAIKNYNSIPINNINHFPLSITYLETLGGNEEYTNNYVGTTNKNNPNLIVMNDFIIQFFDKKEQIAKLDFYGLNDNDYNEFINYKEITFKVKILTDEKRKQFLSKLLLEEKVKPTTEFLLFTFKNLWMMFFHQPPSEKIIKEYWQTVIGDTEINVLQYSQENIKTLTYEFIKKYIR